MGATTSKHATTAVVQATSLAPMPRPLVVVGPGKGFQVSRRYLAHTTRQIAGSLDLSVQTTLTVRSASADGGRGRVAFTIDAAHVLRDAECRCIAYLSAEAFPQGFSIVHPKVHEPLAQIDRIFRRPLDEKHCPMILTECTDRGTGETVTIWYAGDWTLAHCAVFWLSRGRDGPRRPVAKVFPSAASRKVTMMEPAAPSPGDYCIEVAAGMDTGLVLLLCHALDCVGDRPSHHP